MDGNNRIGRGRHPGIQGPMWVGELDIACPPSRVASASPDPSGVDYLTARILIRFQSEPIGMMTVPMAGGEIDVAAVRREAADTFRAEIAAVAAGPWDPSAEPLPAIPADLMSLAQRALPAVSVIIGTRNRPQQVIECINLVLKQDYPSPFEVIVVDNGASDSSTADAVASAFGKDERVRYMVEARPGLSRARNIGLAAAAYPISAFLSDDIRVDSLWLLAIARGFARDQKVQCVTGLCPPLYLDSKEQLLFESSMAWGTRQGFEPRLYALDEPDDPVHPYRVGSFVNGSNMIFDTPAFRSIGGFDETLGPGTKARGGEDLDAPIRILTYGGLIAFEPAVIGWHADKYDDRAFGQHMYTYGLGLTAFLTKHLLDSRYRRGLLVRIPKGFPLLFKAFSERDDVMRSGVSVPLKYYLWQFAGRLAGPFAYLRNRRPRQQ